ncbi:MAG: hypothetical protein J5709_00085 [Bacteroidales bacterium]|nr:hypothetical protein [Bacteroidales bacterium]
MMKKYLIILLAVMAFSVSAKAQIKDTCINVWQCEVNYAYQFSLTDMNATYGKNPSTMGLGLSFKTKHNWIFGFEGSYLWGGYTDNGVSILRGIMTQSGNIINSYGNYGTVLMTQSGFYVGVKTGRVFAFRKPNPNSGIVVNVGAGLLEHHIRIENRSNNTPPVLGDYKKGYDGLRNGIALRGFLGYQFLSNKKLINFYGGVEYTFAWTKSIRNYDFNLRGKDETQYHDSMIGIRIGWILPVYRHAPEEYYYY